jgi:hypothetical protein
MRLLLGSALLVACTQSFGTITVNPGEQRYCADPGVGEPLTVTLSALPTESLTLTWRQASGTEVSPNPLTFNSTGELAATVYINVHPLGANFVTLQPAVLSGPSRDEFLDPQESTNLPVTTVQTVLPEATVRLTTNGSAAEAFSICPFTRSVLVTSAGYRTQSSLVSVNQCRAEPRLVPLRLQGRAGRDDRAHSGRGLEQVCVHAGRAHPLHDDRPHVRHTQRQHHRTEGGQLHHPLETHWPGVRLGARLYRHGWH